MEKQSLTILILALILLSGCRKEKVPVISTSDIDEITETAVTGGKNAIVSLRIEASNFMLTFNTTYHYRVVAVNQYGTAHGDDMTFTTLSKQVQH